MNLKKKGQISIYLIIGVIILTILLFLIFVDSDEKQNNLKQGQANIKPLNEETSLVKTRIDYCLTNELKKALIIAGLKGGYIYDKNEYTFGGIIPKNTYSPKLISNLDLNWNALQSKVIVYSSIIPTPSEIQNNTLIYNGEYIFNHTTSQDFEKFITSNFLKCLNFEDLNKTYEFNYTDYYGKVSNINYPNNELTVSNIDGEIGDKIRIDLENQDIIGTIKKKEKENFIVKFTNLANLKNEKITTVDNLNVINLKTNLDLNIDFNYEDISLKAHFPVTIKNGKSISTFEDTTIKLDVRFKALLEFAKELVNNKYYIQKDLDYSNKDDVYKALNKSEYFKTTKLKKFTLSQKTIKNEDEHKQFVYSIIDHDSKINGNPYVFNFAYENEAPTIDFKTINPNFEIDEQTTIISLVATKGDEIKYELRPHTKEKQIYDNHILYFEPQEYSALDAEFKLTENGSLYFKPQKEKLYTYPIKVTDGETVREHIINFITGFPDNNNNTAAKECIKFKNFNDVNGLFPISSEFKNKIYLYKSGEYENVFALSPYYPNNIINENEIRKSQIYFAKTCVYNTDMYTIKAYQADNNGRTEITSQIYQDDRYFKLDVPQKIFTLKYTFEIISNEGTQMTEPFNITIYPSKCLGPDSMQTGIGVSCCDINSIKSKISTAISTSNPSTLNFIDSSDLKNQGETIYNKNVYACYNFREIPNENNKLYDYSNNNIWGTVGKDISSLFETNLEIKCQGEFPSPMQNINKVSISGGNNYGTLFGIFENKQENNFVNNTPISLKKVKTANTCEFCSLEKQEGFSLVTNYKGKKLTFNIGSKEENSNEIFVLPNKQEYANVNVLCDDSNWYASSSKNPFAVSDWTKITNNFGEDGNPENLHISLGYCSLGDNKCSGKKNSPSYKVKEDSTLKCEDYYANSQGNINVKANSGWDCSTGTCQNGICK